MDNLTALVTNLYDVRKQKTALDKVEKTILVELKPLVDPMLDKYADAGEEIKMGVGNLVLSRGQGTTRNISADLLLERGVAPDVIQYATKTTVYFRYLVKEA